MTRIQLVNQTEHLGKSYFVTNTDFEEVIEGEAKFGEGITLLTMNLRTCVCLSILANNATGTTTGFVAHLNVKTDHKKLCDALDVFLNDKTSIQIYIISGSENFLLFPPSPKVITSKVNVFFALHCLHTVTKMSLRDLYSRYLCSISRSESVGVLHTGKLTCNLHSRNQLSFDDFMLALKKEVAAVFGPMYERDSAFVLATNYFPDLGISREETITRNEILNMRNQEICTTFNFFVERHNLITASEKRRMLAEDIKNSAFEFART